MKRTAGRQAADLAAQPTRQMNWRIAWCLLTIVGSTLAMIYPANAQQTGFATPGFQERPQTDLTPIGPPALGSQGVSGQTQPGASAPPASFPPPATSGPMFDPYATAGPTSPTAGGTILGSPLALPGTAPAPGSGSGYPGGSFLGRLFSGSTAAGPPPSSGAMASPFSSGVFASGPTTLNPPAMQPGYGAPGYGAPGYGVPGYGVPGYGVPGRGGNAYAGPPQTYGAPAYPPPPAFGGGVYPSSVYPSGSPSTLFPGGLFGPAGIGGVFATDPNVLNSGRFFQGTRLRHLFVGGGDGPNDLGVNNTDVSVAFAFQNFLYSGRPVYVVPSFGLHLWDGPKTGGGQTADLPSNTYDAFLDFGWQTDPNQMFGAEFGVRVGVFSDFDTMNSDSLRVIGKGLGSFRLTPASTLKAGVYYLDRNDIKLLPAGGLLWQPSPNTRFDIFFPEPKLSKYCRTIGTQDVWWYLAGEFGGGSWTITRANGMEDSFDLNQIQATVGWEWGQSQLIRTGRRRAFFEFGYVFDREVIYDVNPQDNFAPDGAFVVRGGFGY